MGLLRAGPGCGRVTPRRPAVKDEEGGGGELHPALSAALTQPSRAARGGRGVQPGARSPAGGGGDTFWQPSGGGSPALLLFLPAPSRPSPPPPPSPAVSSLPPAPPVPQRGRLLPPPPPQDVLAARRQRRPPAAAEGRGQSRQGAEGGLGRGQEAPEMAPCGRRLLVPPGERRAQGRPHLRRAGQGRGSAAASRCSLRG